MRRMRRMLLLSFSLLILAAFVAGCGMVRVNPEVDNKTVVAKVSGQDITKEEFNKVYTVFKAQYEQQYGADVWNQEVNGKKFGDVAKDKLLDMLIDEKIQMKKASELGITVTDQEINTEIENAKKYFDSEDKFNEFLKNQSMDLQYYKDSVKKDLIISKLTEKLTADVSVTDNEVKSYYDSHQSEFVSVKASHILLDTKEEAEKMLQRVKAGEDFNALAKQYSKDPSAKENSGELGYFKHGEMVEAFENAAFALKPGEISDVVQSDFGYHIIKVEDNKLEKYNDAKEELKSKLLGDKKNTEYEKLLADMRSKAQIQKFTKNLN
ncbi:MAG: peptidylprolyl isomerase [Caulobacteraceae bacterium]